MIICHCNQLTKAELELSISSLSAVDPERGIKPQAVHAHLGCRSRCCGCYPQLKKMIDATNKSGCLELARS